MKKKVFILFVLIFILSACTNRTDSSGTISVPNPGNTIIGGERDSHGCLTPAGQHWCSSANKCLGPEELCK